MKSSTHIPAKRSLKEDRQYRVLLGLVDFYLKTGKPVGSHTLQEVGFSDLSSATLRNYFACLEEEGYLAQLHSSGGRIPTDKAYRIYAFENKDTTIVNSSIEEELQQLRKSESKEITLYLAHAAELLSRITKTAVFLSSPRFDHDYILDIRVIPIDASRCLCILITDFGVIKTEVLHTNKKLSSFSTKRIESYFISRLQGREKPSDLSEEEEELARSFYNEVMVRYIVNYSNFSNEEVFRVGLSQLLHYPEFGDAPVLANSLSLFENNHSMRLLLRECNKMNTLKFWIGSDLAPYSNAESNCSILAIPYRINNHPVGAFGLLGPLRIPYKELFGILHLFNDYVSETLTRTIYKFKISFRQPQKEPILISQKEKLLLEDHSNIVS